MSFTPNSQLPYFSGFDAVPPQYKQQLWPEALPFYLQVEAASTVVVCLHGFTGVPYEIRPIAQACQNRGMDAVALLLPGHGYAEMPKQKKFFPQMTKEGFLAATRQEIARAREKYARVVIYGHSMGGIIALAMAGEGLVDACIASAPALRIPRHLQIALDLFGWLNVNLPKEQETRFYLPCYSFDNSRAGRQLLKIARYAEKVLSQIDCPVFILHSRQDQTIPPVVCDIVKEEVPGKVKTKWYDGSSHSLPLDVRGEEVARDVAEFLVSNS